MVTGATSTSNNNNNTDNASSIKSEMGNDSNSSNWMDSSSNISSTSPGLNCSNPMSSSNKMVIDNVNVSSNTKKSISDNRRSNKPIMEKRRRARINNCLNELKNLLLDAMKKDPARHSKLEKADILEMTVKYLANIQKQQQQQQQPQSPNTEYGLNKYKAGFNQCFSEVTRFPGLEPEIKTRLLHHLSACINKLLIQQSTQSQTQQIQSPPIQLQNQVKKDDMRSSVQVHILPNELQVSSRQYDVPQVVQNGIFVSNGVQLVPTRLPNGDIALILPNSYQNTPHVVKSSFIPVAAVPPSNTGHANIDNTNQNHISFGTNLKTKLSPAIYSETTTVPINNNYVDIQEKSISPLPLIVPKKTDSMQSTNQPSPHAYQYKQLQEQSDQPQQDVSPWRPW